MAMVSNDKRLRKVIKKTRYKTAGWIFQLNVQESIFKVLRYIKGNILLIIEIDTL